MGDTSAKRRNVALLVVCALLGVGAALCLLDLRYVTGHIAGDRLAYAVVVVAVATLLDASFILVLIAEAVALWRSEAVDTTDAVNRCQSHAIVSGGLCIIDWITDSLADNAVNENSLFVTIATCVVIGAYYFLVRGMSHTTFWDGIRETPHLSPYLSVGDVSTELTLDASTGRLRPAKPGATTCVTVITVDEYLEQAPVNIIQQIIHTVRDVRRSSCIQLSDIVFGSVFIAAEVQRAAGFEAGDDLRFSYQFLDGKLTLIMPEDGVERVFLAQSLVDQYLVKSTALSFIAEMVVVLSLRLSDWLSACESRLVKLGFFIAAEFAYFKRRRWF